MSPAPTFVRRFDTLTNNDVPIVGGKNASLGEMIGALKDEGIRVPDGFATTADAYWHYLDANELEAEIRAQLAALSAGEQSLAETGAAIRDLIRNGTMPDEMAGAILEAYRALSAAYDADAIDVAARSSATAEDLPEASFAGQQESFLNVRGDEAVLDACKNCFASLFTDRAVTYREEQGFDHMEVALSVGLQKMVRADKAGVMFTIDTESGFPDNAIINAGWGLGETVVKGSINPDQYTVYKPFLENEALTPIVGKTKGDKAKKIVYAEGDGEPTKTVETTEEERNALVLSDDEILTLARWGARIEEHYDRPMDIEWARDGETEALFILQARPETVQSQRAASVLRTYRLQETGERLVTGLSIGQSIAEGEVQLIHSADEIEKFEEGGILVTDMTDPDWGPILKKAAGIVTNHGGRTREPRARHSGRHRHGERDRDAHRRAGGHALVCGGGRGVRLRGPSGVRHHGARPGRASGDGDPHYAQRGQSGGGAQLVAAASRGHWARPDGVHRQQRHRGASDGPRGLRPGGR